MHLPPGTTFLLFLLTAVASVPSTARAVTTGHSPTPEATTMLRRILLRDDKHPNSLGEASIFVVVSGTGQDGKPRTEVHPLPWVKRDRTWYDRSYPLVDWRRFTGGYVTLHIYDRTSGEDVAHVDTFYVIQPQRKYLLQNGAAGNAVLSLEPGAASAR
ncbi:MAG: DUF3103 family protein [Luteibacter sp.]|uniref:DUF3103 family protein n=1 Tax=Luteibacter sp. TaxID=1886636 RepID=UPI002807F912|nr:DUF3103 family protein [Luteibacter sp.]MDQ7996454.1 DUF3103 family protein [Luteibacter sp.]MDQ8047918.1 DUF3103 family protein [Luteibacter sp.]